MASDTTDAVTAGEDALNKYHDYLERCYVGGSEMFFSPTGFIETFQKTVEVDAQKARNLVFARSIDEAERLLVPAVAGREGVFDLCAEPGTGKTSVLPFRFSTKKVVVALPSPFDAWAAYQMATGDCHLRFKGLSLGNSSANVVFTDSYFAARAVLSGYMDYDILIVDECDSHRGVTKFLSEVKAPGKLLIRMSASYGRTQSGPSKTFRITEVADMPDVRHNRSAVIDYVMAHRAGRNLLLLPDADTALEVGAMLPDSSVVCSKSDFRVLVKSVLNQEGDVLYVADDVCSRSLNFNLDNVFDSQLIAENGVVRPITPAELYQRKHRVGRNRPGWYRSPGLSTKEFQCSDVDLVRHNVVRSFAGVQQQGESRLHLSRRETDELLGVGFEPYSKLMKMRTEEVAITSSSSSARSKNLSPVSSGRSSSLKSSHSRAGSIESTVVAPSWLFAFSGGSTATTVGVDRKTGNSAKYIVKRADSHGFVRRKSSSSDDRDSREYSDSERKPSSLVKLDSSRRHHRRRDRGSRALLPVAQDAPYSAPARRTATLMQPLALPAAPPLMDLTELTYDLDWPALIRDRLVHGGDLPTLVPPASWRHTSVGGIGSDWFKRLDDVAVGDPKFDERELEIVCRAWNLLVAQSWTKRTPGLSDASNYDRLEFCARYFQSHFLLSSAE